MDGRRGAFVLGGSPPPAPGAASVRAPVARTPEAIAKASPAAIARYGTPEAIEEVLTVWQEVIAELEAALRIIGTPSHVPQGFDPFDWWKHTACKRGEIARDALGVTAEQLISDQWDKAVRDGLV